MAELQARMSEQEFRRWVRFYRQQPFDDIHRYYRPAVLQASAFGGGDMAAMMDFLLNKEVVQEAESEDVGLSVFRAFGVVPPKQFADKAAEAV